MKSFVLAGLTLLSLLLILSFGGLALTEKVGMTNNMTTPMNMTTPINMKMPMSMPMEMPNKMANGSMEMIMLQNVTLNIVLVQNLTEVTNTIMPASINATNGNKTNALNAVKPFAKNT
ncbi:Uncharacterised protein [uncultured archaeon]|nr:Uncharacterised protein [uncultured archaeon]